MRLSHTAAAVATGGAVFDDLSNTDQLRGIVWRVLHLVLSPGAHQSTPFRLDDVAERSSEALQPGEQVAYVVGPLEQLGDRTTDHGQVDDVLTRPLARRRHRLDLWGPNTRSCGLTRANAADAGRQCLAFSPASSSVDAALEFGDESA